MRAGEGRGGEGEGEGEGEEERERRRRKRGQEERIFDSRFEFLSPRLERGPVSRLGLVINHPLRNVA